MLMTLREAEALAAFLNRCQTRYYAQVFPAGKGEAARVLLTDNNAPANSAPIPLTKEGAISEVSPECQSLIEVWQHGRGRGYGRAGSDASHRLSDPDTQSRLCSHLVARALRAQELAAICEEIGEAKAAHDCRKIARRAAQKGMRLLWHLEQRSSPEGRENRGTGTIRKNLRGLARR